MSVALLAPDDVALLDRVRNAHSSAEAHHDSFRKKADRFYGKYRSHRELKKNVRQARADGTVDELLRDTSGPFGADLFIPYCFTVIETTVARMLSQNPRMLIRPGDRTSEGNVDNVDIMLGRQQSKIGYPLILQDVAKEGLIYGLAWQKVLWNDKPAGKRPVLQPGLTSDKPWVVGEQERTGYCGPIAEACSPYDIFWDPNAHSVESSRWIMHRQWRDNAYVKRMIEQEKWILPAGVALDELLSGGSSTDRDEIWSDRMAAGGYDNPNRRGDHLHEVWEFHDAVSGEVITIIDRDVPVMAGDNPFWHGELPFQCYRPTKIPHEMVGYGEIEAIEDLQDELNILRSQRRDNAAIVLQRPYFYFDGMLDPNDFVFGPGKAIPVDGDPRNIIFPAPLQDIPNSGYQEDAALQRDIERTSGLDDTVMGAEGGGGASSTATGAQLVNAAANIRIQGKTKRIEQETVQPACRQFLFLNQQFIIEKQEFAGPPRPGEMTHKAWSWYEIGPEQLAGEFEVECEAGSMSPQSKIERQEKAKAMHMVFANNPLVNQRKLTENTLEEGFEVTNPAGTGWLAPEEPSISPEAWDLIRDEIATNFGVNPEELEELAVTAQELVDEAQGGGGGAPQGPEGAPGGSPGPQAAPVLQ